MLRALYDNRICNVIEASGDLLLEDRDGNKFAVEYSDERLNVDPTDAQVAYADNLAEWYAVDEEQLRRLRLVLLGDLSVSEWRR